MKAIKRTETIKKRTKRIAYKYITSPQLLLFFRLILSKYISISKFFSFKEKNSRKKAYFFIYEKQAINILVTGAFQRKKTKVKQLTLTLLNNDVGYSAGKFLYQIAVLTFNHYAHQRFSTGLSQKNPAFIA